MDWELIKTIIGYISGPLIGAFIGLITNYLAVKMLFRPYYPKKIFGVRIPFTPGIIPKRKDALAHGIGLAVGEDLFTGDDLKNLLCSEKIEQRLISNVKNALKEQASRSFDELVSSVASKESIDTYKDKISLFLAEKIISSAKKMDIGEIVATKGKEALVEKKASLGMLGMFLTDGIVDPLLAQVKDKVSLFLEEEGVETALPAIREEVSLITGAPIDEQIDFSSLDEEKITSVVKSLYESLVIKAIDAIASDLDICSIVEEKVKKMPLRDLEALCLKIMKRELRALVILGGIIGLIIGIINIFV